MDLWPLRTLALELILGAHGVAATVTRPAPDNTPITTTVIWHSKPADEQQPTGVELFSKVGPRRVMVIPRATVATLPRGTSISAPERGGGTAVNWTVDNSDHVEADCWHAIVRRA
ncbi:MAG TPA: hypothetical protein VNJ02_10580 [Vicinamibacterales bacterium]|nr:hypothetical protein [Vicinamibacterales bacterium]